MHAWFHTLCTVLAQSYIICILYLLYFTHNGLHCVAYKCLCMLGLHWFKLSEISIGWQKQCDHDEHQQHSKEHDVRGRTKFVEQVFIVGGVPLHRGSSISIRETYGCAGTPGRNSHGGSERKTAILMAKSEERHGRCVSVSMAIFPR